MSQCVPSWDVDDNPPPPRLSLRSNSSSTAPDVPMLDYEVAELTWENGQLSMHGLGLPRVPVKPPTSAANKYTWEKPRASGTLESIVNQATSLPHREKPTLNGDGGVYGNFLVPWLDRHGSAATANTVTMDALVPCSKREQSKQGMESVPSTCMVGCSTRVGSCGNHGAKGQEMSGRDQSVSGSATFGRDSKHVTLDTCDREFGVALTSTSINSLDNTSSAKHCTKTTTVDDHDSVSHSKPVGENGDDEKKKRANGKSSVSTKRSRAAAIHNQSERKRRDKINQRMKTLQKLVPNSSKTDKASMLDEVIEYLKQLQAQVQMMNRINMSSMMLPLTMQQQLQMSMMSPMGMGLGMGMGMGMGMDMNSMNRANIPAIPAIPPVLHPSAFMPMAASWDAAAAGGGGRFQGNPATVMPDPLSTFFGCQSQPMTMDTYSRLAAMYQQLHQPPVSGSKN